MLLRMLAALLVMLLAARAETAPVAEWNAAEQWVWLSIAAGRTADFDTPCHASTAPPAADPTGADACRTVRGAVLEQMLTQPPWRDAMQHRGTRIVGAHIAGGLDLANAHVAPAVVIARSRIDGDIAATHAHLENIFALDGSFVSGQVEATGLLDRNCADWNRASLFRNGGDV